MDTSALIPIILSAISSVGAVCSAVAAARSARAAERTIMRQSGAYDLSAMHSFLLDEFLDISPKLLLLV